MNSTQVTEVNPPIRLLIYSKCKKSSSSLLRVYFFSTNALKPNKCIQHNKPDQTLSTDVLQDIKALARLVGAHGALVNNSQFVLIGGKKRQMKRWTRVKFYGASCGFYSDPPPTHQSSAFIRHLRRMF